MRGVHTVPKGIWPKVNVIARLEYELAYYDSAFHRCNHYTTRTPLLLNGFQFSKWLNSTIWPIVWPEQVIPLRDGNDNAGVPQRPPGGCPTKVDMPLNKKTKSSSPKLQGRSLTITWFSVISRILVRGVSYSSSDVQSVYSTAAADWTPRNLSVL